MNASLSRWSMAYFATALVALLVAEILMAGGFGYPGDDPGAPATLIVVHLVAIGWLSLLMFGALFQFLPVLLARPLYSQALPLPTLAALIAGLAALIGGFAQLGGWLAPGPDLLAWGAGLLGLGVTLALWNLGRTLVAGGARSLPVRYVTLGLASVAATAALGIVFALTLSGLPVPAAMATLAEGAVPVHAALGLGGWLTVTAMGVSYRLLAMFMLAPELERRGSRAGLVLAVTAVATALGGGLAAIAAGRGPGPMLLIAAAAGTGALLFYGRDIVHLYRNRKRPRIELNSRVSILALASLAASVALLGLLLVLGRLGRDAGALVFLVAMGWLTGLGLAQLYKITAFVTWLECYGPVLGRVTTPRVQDLVDERRALPWFVLHFAASWTGTAALLAGAPLLFRLAAAGLVVALLGILRALLGTRRLSVVDAAHRLPPGARMPPLLFARLSPINPRGKPRKEHER